MKNPLSSLTRAGRAAAAAGPLVITDLRSVAAACGWRYDAVHPATVQQCDPSWTIPEEIRDLLHAAPTLLRRDCKGTSPATPERAAMYYSQLHAATRYPIEETFTCEIPHAVLAAPAGVAFTGEGELLAQSSFDREIAAHPPAVANPEFLPGRWVSLLSLFVVKSNYAHWLMDALPRLALLQDRGDDFHILVPAAPARFIVDSLLLAGVAREKIRELPANGARVETLIFAHAAQRSGVPCAPHLLGIRDRLLHAVGGQAAQPRCVRRIYVSRARSARRLSNERDLKPVLHDFGFECVCCEDLDFAGQVRLFSETGAVAGPHGAGIFNQLFCPPGSTVIEIFNHQWWDHAPRKIASIMGHRHWHLFGESAGAGFETKIKSARFAKVLSCALTAAGPAAICETDY